MSVVLKQQCQGITGNKVQCSRTQVGTHCYQHVNQMVAVAKPTHAHPHAHPHHVRRVIIEEEDDEVYDDAYDLSEEQNIVVAKKNDMVAHFCEGHTPKGPCQKKVKGKTHCSCHENQKVAVASSSHTPRVRKEPVVWDSSVARDARLEELEKEKAARGGQCCAFTQKGPRCSFNGKYVIRGQNFCGKHC